MHRNKDYESKQQEHTDKHTETDLKQHDFHSKLAPNVTMKLFTDKANTQTANIHFWQTNTAVTTLLTFTGSHQLY